MSGAPELRIEPLDLRTKHVFGLSRGAEQVFHNLVFTLRADGLEGLGECAPSAYYGENRDTARAAAAAYWEAARAHAPGILAAGDPMPAMEALHGEWDRKLRRNNAARGGLDAALWDLWGKRHGMPVWRAVWGEVALNCPQTSYTIAIDAMDTLPARLREAEPYAFLKVKLGGPDDLGTLQQVKAGAGKPIRVDANCAWRGEEAVRHLRPLVELGLEMIEQPCPPRDLDGLAAVHAAFRVPVYADESAETLEDLEVLPGRCDGVNVKLVKSGGITRAVRAIRRARELGFGVMLGCMIESSLGIAAAVHLAPMVDRIDLDGALLIEADPFQGIDWRDGRPVPPTAPGLGVSLRA